MFNNYSQTYIYHFTDIWKDIPKDTYVKIRRKKIIKKKCTTIEKEHVCQVQRWNMQIKIYNQSLLKTFHIN